MAEDIRAEVDAMRTVRETHSASDAGFVYLGMKLERLIGETAKLTSALSDFTAALTTPTKGKK